MSLKKITQYIPYTEARRNRLFGLSLMRHVGKHEALLQVEWPDGTESFQPADWNPETSAWETPSGQRWYKKGLGGEPHTLMGVPIVHVDADNAGVVSAQAAKAANREARYGYVDADGRELEVLETNADGEPVEVAYVDSGERVAADGGQIELCYDMGSPPGYDGEVIDRRVAGLFDPFPVSRVDADQAVEHAINASQDPRGELRLVLIGIGIGLGIPVLLMILNWLMATIGGGNGGGGSSIGFMLLSWWF